MDIQIHELQERYCRFTVEGVHPYFVNALRRVLVAEVPKLAIDQVTFYDNSSALFDEIIAHRLGLLPILTDKSTLNMVDKVDEEGNPEYLVRYTLTKEGPAVVYSGDLECEDPEFELEDKEIPIVSLLEGQRLILECAAVLGRGTDHAKWQVASGVGYKYYPTAQIDNRKISGEAAKAAVENTPTGILQLDGTKLVVADAENVNQAYDAETIIGSDGFHIDYDDRKFIFQFETDGALKAEDALLTAVELVKERFKSLGEAIDHMEE